MPDYRVYLVGKDGHFKKSIPQVCAGDDAAKQEAEQLVDGHDIELWQRDRKIARFERKPKMTQMPETNDRKELEQRLEQARRAARHHDDPVTKDRLGQLIRDMEDQLR
jgi:hypothetical protein